MKRVLTATCLAATFAVGLAAQSTSTANQEPPMRGQGGGGPRTVTGCLRAGDTAGSYMLTDVVMPAGRRGGDAAAGSTAGAAGSTTAATGENPQGARATTPPVTLMLSAPADVDLKPHVGHKIEVTGTLAGGRGGRPGDAATTGTATGTGTTGTGTTGTGTTGSGATGTTTGSGTGTGTSASGGGQAGRGGPRNMTVTSIRMISESCS
jgi:hypothetical protein